MKKLWRRWVCCIATIATLIPATAQTRGAARGTAASTVEPGSAGVEKEIDDPNSGLRWVVVEDPAHPGGPGRLVLSGKGGAQNPLRPNRVKAAKMSPVIHAGDAVQVQEHSAVVDASLQAVALGSAGSGCIFRVRLRIGGRVLKVRALAAGRAELEPDGERP